VSVVLRAPSSDGAFFLKCSGDIFRHEAMTTRALAAQLPDAFPEVVAVDASEGWLLMCDLGAPELGEQAQSLWHEGLVTHAGVQRSWLGRADELVGLGLPDRSLTALADEVGEISDDDTVQSRMDPELRDRWRSSAPSLVAACLRLEEIGPGPSLVHGDLHPWNVTYGSGTTRIFDWTDAAVSHPFVDLPTYLFRTDDVAVRRRMVDAYLDAWSTAGSPAQLREAADLAVIVGSLYQVQTYRVLIPTLMNDGADDDLADGDLSWIRRTLARLECGLDGPDGAD
jgi:aminoglycoside/choline kinase family phosphotransferase